MAPFSSRDRNAALALGAVFLVVYGLTLQPFGSRVFPDHWLYGADSYRVSFDSLLAGHGKAAYQVTKHSAFVGVALPLHHLAQLVLACDTTTCPNAPPTFAVAVFGALNVGLAYYVMRVIGFMRRDAILASTFYGTGLAVWFFSAFPDTPVFVALLTNVFLLIFLTDPQRVRTRLLAFVNGVAALAAPQLVLLGLIPVASFLRRGGDNTKRNVLRYVVSSAPVFLVPFVGLLLVIYSRNGPLLSGLQFPVNELNRWASPAHLLEGGQWFKVVMDFVVRSQGGVYIDPAQKTLGAALPAALITLALFVSYGVWGAVRSGWRAPFEGSKETGLFLAAYTVFFVVYSPSESFLFSAPFVLPLWLLLHGGHAQQANPGNVWRAGLLIATVVFASTNFAHMSRYASPLWTAESTTTSDQPRDGRSDSLSHFLQLTSRQ